MDFVTYTKYLNFAWDEEMERVQEWLYARRHNKDWGEGGDKYWIGLPLEQIGCPSYEELQETLKGRDIAQDMAVIDGPDSSAKEDLYLALRDSL